MEIHYTQEEISKIVHDVILPKLKEKKIFTFTGPLGAGKTTLIKEIFKQCGITEIVSSPTFGYVKSYKDKEGRTFHHFDLYRVDSIESFIHEGLDEYFYQDNALCFVEWPEVIEGLLLGSDVQESVCQIFVEYFQDNKTKRLMTVS